MGFERFCQLFTRFKLAILGIALEKRFCGNDMFFLGIFLNRKDLLPAI